MSENPCICINGHYHSSVAMAARCQPTGEKQEKRYSVGELRELLPAWEAQYAGCGAVSVASTFVKWLEEREGA